MVGIAVEWLELLWFGWVYGGKGVSESQQREAWLELLWFGWVYGRKAVSWDILKVDIINARFDTLGL